VTEHAEDPVGQASSKVAQYVSLATMAAEAIAQVRQQRAAALAAADEHTVRAVRAQQTAARAAARLQWSPVLDPRRRNGLNLADTGLAWAASQAWRTLDPEAQLASDFASQRLRELRPDVMARYDRLTAEGVDDVDAMRRVAPFFDRPPARPGEHAARPPLVLAPAPTAADRSPGPDITADAAADGGVDTSSSASRQHYIDTGTYLPAGAAAAAESGPLVGEADAVDAAVQAYGAVDPAAAGAVAAEDARADGGQHPHPTGAVEQPAGSQDAATSPGLRLRASRTPPQLAKDGYPEPLTGEVLAAGRIKPKPTDRTAPAAVRSVGLATAARASRMR
jgi:hypothetical protein